MKGAELKELPIEEKGEPTLKDRQKKKSKPKLEDLIRIDKNDKGTYFGSFGKSWTIISAFSSAIDNPLCSDC